MIIPSFSYFQTRDIVDILFSLFFLEEVKKFRGQIYMQRPTRMRLNFEGSEERKLLCSLAKLFRRRKHVASSSLREAGH